MNRKKVYWLCQIIGWTGYTLADMVIYLLRDGYSTGIVFNALLTVVFGIAITHLYRLFIKRLRWSSLPLPQIIVRTLLSVQVVALVMVLISVPLDYFTVPTIRNRITDIGGVPVLFLAYYFLTWSKNLLLWSVIYHMYQYFSLGKKAEIERVQLESSVKDFEVKILRAQLNPHFMFNSLNSIRALINEDPSKAKEALTQLSGLLRNSLLSDRQKTVSLNEELKTVQDYLSLEKIRYEDRLNVQTNISPDTLNVQVPPMMVQTLVENAVKHGISKPIRGGFISIDAQLDRNFLNLTIRNTGKLETKPDHDGVGMLNTAQRLALIYGECATFRLNQETDEVVRAEVRLPVQA
jgi:sensor histidine kinase YesM